MPALPLSVRLALWATAAFHGHTDLDEAIIRAHPDVDDVSGDAPVRLALWRDLGESAVLVALPRPGDLTGMPRSGPEAAGAAAAAGECVFAPGLGGLLVPALSTYGPPGDQGLAAEWTAYEGEPVARHVLEAVTLAELERAFALAVRDGADTLAAVGGRPWSSAPRDEAERRLGAAAGGLPAGTPPRATHLMLMVARVAVIVDEGLQLAASGPALDLHSSNRREGSLRSLQAAADRALAGAANVAVMELAGWRPA